MTQLAATSAGQSDLLATIVQLIIAAVTGSAFVTFLNLMFTRRKVSAEAENVAVTTANSMVISLREEIARLRLRLEAAEAKADEADNRSDFLEAEMRNCRRVQQQYEDHIDALESALRRAGIPIPVWQHHYIPKERPK